MAYFKCKFDNKQELEGYAYFSGLGDIQLPFTLNANHKITVDFEVDQYRSNCPVIGNSSSGGYCHLTPFSNKWYTSNGSSETNFNGELTGRHTYIFNDNGVNKFDDNVVVSSVNPVTNSNVFYKIGGRSGAGGTYLGKLYSYKIEDLSTGSTICDIKVVERVYNNVDDLYLVDVINNQIYTCNGMSCNCDDEWKPRNFEFKNQFTIYEQEKYGTTTSQTSYGTKDFKKKLGRKRATLCGGFWFYDNVYAWGHPLVLISDNIYDVYYESGDNPSGFYVAMNGRKYYFSSNGRLIQDGIISSNPSNSIPIINTPETRFDCYEDGIIALINTAYSSPHPTPTPEPEPTSNMYANFTGQGSIELPYSYSSNYKIKVDFETTIYSTNMSIIGNTYGGSYCHLTQFNSRWYSSNGSSEFNFSANLTGRHTFIFNDEYETDRFDGKIIANTNVPFGDSQSSVHYVIGGRNGAGVLTGKIYSFVIYDLRTNERVAHIMPVKTNNGNVFRDIINNIDYTCNGMTIVDPNES